MVENGLSLEFDISNSDDSAVGIVNILPICKMPEESRRSQSSLQFLAWLLFDQNARASFESIYINQIQNGNDTAQYRRWMFEFDQPQLSGVELSVHGIFDKKKNQFFIWEINAIEKLYCDIPQEIVFIDPHFSTSLSGGVGGASQSGTNIPDFELDDDQTPDVDLKLIEIDSPTMCFEFKNPPSIKRVGTGHSRSVKGSNPTGKVELAPTVVDVSTLESSDKAILSSVKLKKVTRPPYPNIVFRLPRFHRFPSGSPRRFWSMIPCWEKSSQLLSYA
jgi:hypothetical protein